MCVSCVAQVNLKRQTHGSVILHVLIVWFLLHMHVWRTESLIVQANNIPSKQANNIPSVFGFLSIIDL